MNNKYIASTGMLIKDYLNEYSINQKSLANRTGISERHISNVLNGKNRLTEDFALKLEKVLPSIKASYWLNYEAKYREHIARDVERKNLSKLDLKSISKRFKFQEVYKGLNLSIVEQAIEMMKLLKISDFSQFDDVYGNLATDFMEDGGERESMAIWLNLCESEIEIENDSLDDKKFDISRLEDTLWKFKILSNNNDTVKSLISCRKLCNQLGIYFIECEAITNSKIRGALTSYKNHPAIYISGRFKTHSHIWFAILHELSHLVLHYNKREALISFEEDIINERESEANTFARDILVSSEKYSEFVKSNNFTEDSIVKFSKKENILPCFTVAFLKHDKLIEYSQFTYL